VADTEGAFLTKGDLAYYRVRARILAGEFAPGAVIRQEVLADEIGISVTPLREALRRLKSEGLVVLDAHRDARVSELTAEEARHLYEVRTSLDSLAAGLAAQRRTEASVNELRESAERLQPLAGGAGEDAVRAHRQFHTALYRASGNPVLIGMLDDLWDKSDRYRRLGLELIAGSAEPRMRDYQEHFRLMELVVAGDSEGAAALMRRHVQSSLNALVIESLGEQAPDDPPSGNGPHPRRNRGRPENPGPAFRPA